jgi:hypothetical protein
MTQPTQPTVFGSTTRTPTIIGQQSAPTPMTPMQQPVATSPVAVASQPIDYGAIVLTPQQAVVAEQKLNQLDFATIPAANIVKIGFEEEQRLQQTLDGFLARLDKKNAGKVFELFKRLDKGVDDAKLPEIVKKIEEGEKTGFFSGLAARFGFKNADEMAREAQEKIAELITGRTKTLSDVMSDLERDLQGEMVSLFNELSALNQLKTTYSAHFADFTVAAAVARAFLQRGQQVVAAMEQQFQATPNDAVLQAQLQELKSKLRLVESRALALEGAYTRLPADQMVIQQIENAGITTLQETATTMSSRLGSIKMTLLTIHGAFEVRNLQQINARHPKMDAQLTSIRGTLLKEAATAAAAQPGINRLEQARQIQEIITQTKEIHALVAAAERKTDQDFEQARQSFAAARKELASLNSR